MAVAYKAGRLEMASFKSRHQSDISLVAGKESIVEENIMKVVKGRELMEAIAISPEVKRFSCVHEISLTEFNHYKDLGTQES